ncbi:hypothetical protein F5884DRAFT_114530 [Xylogone sp. PMI_703]|nr:hypothetical protein F5884DRAFT_114530 [Xylogone sp. PMI_703]
MATFDIPKLPVQFVKDFIPYISKHPDTPISTLVQPFKAFESELRKVYAQEPTHEAVKDGDVNLIPIFAGHEHELKIRARSLSTETEDEKSKYIMSLDDEHRKPSGAPAVVSSLKDFQQNFSLFSESSLCDLDWNNVVAAGSSVTTSLLPVPKEWSGSKRSLREYYHEHFAPASDVDLFLYGLTEEQAIEKIKQIERSVKDALLTEVTTIRTKNAITIASQYPTRHVQIVLRIYDSISQIITGFDVDCACAAYTGDQVYASPRAIASLLTQCNTIDLTRRSPSYENRLSKYSHRGFEVYWPQLDRSRVDPTIFERSFTRTQGLARLLVLEKLPKAADRDSYSDQRRKERGRPPIYRNYRHAGKMKGNIKDEEEDEIAEWDYQDEVSSYHTLTIPYGQKYTPNKIHRLLYAKDLLLNAEWNQPKDREVYLHRHPCFFGTAEEVIEDCCGFCPVPKTDEEIEIAEEESKTFVSGKLSFLLDDPGRQEIGSFNPITDDEWTTMAYVGDTARLCQAIVDGDLEHVQDWCSQEGVDVNRRDYTGRTPLHLAVMSSTPEIVQCLIDHGARLIARLVDGKTALHIAAARGNAQIVKALMDKSLENEEEEERKAEAKRAAKKTVEEDQSDESEEPEESGDGVRDESSDGESIGDSESASEISAETQDVSDSMTMGSFVKIEKEQKDADDGVLEDSEEDPDVYEIDVIAWDYGLSPLHLAILNGNLEVVELLVSEYGADVLLPVKLVQQGTATPRGAILTIVLALSLPNEKAKEMAKLLLKLGATSTQADTNHITALHFVVSENKPDVLDVLLSEDRPAALKVLSNIATNSNAWSGQMDTPLTTAVRKGYEDMVVKLLDSGAPVTIGFEEWIKTQVTKNHWSSNQTPDQNMTQYQTQVQQPLIIAATNGMPKAVEKFIEKGADIQTLTCSAQHILHNPRINHNYGIGETVLDVVRRKLKDLREYHGEAAPRKPEILKDLAHYTQGLKEGSYRYWTTVQNYETALRKDKQDQETYAKALLDAETKSGNKQKMEAILKLREQLESLEEFLLSAGAKTFKELHPDKIVPPGNPPYGSSRLLPTANAPAQVWAGVTQSTFQIPAMTVEKFKGYSKLFEAAWNNDLETIKSLTLAQWMPEPFEGLRSSFWGLVPAAAGAEQTLEPPLEIAIRDGNNFSPYSIAVLRGHYDLAKKIVEIAWTQYHKLDEVNNNRRWRMLQEDSENDYYSDDESQDSNILPIYSELVSDKYTVDTLGEIASVVSSTTSPLTMIEWVCNAGRINGSEDHYWQGSLLRYAIRTENKDLFMFMMKQLTEQKLRSAVNEDDPTTYVIPSSDYQEAIKYGRTHMLAYMIMTTGAGIPLNELVKKSGVEVKNKPRYYQGLTVGGKKRADWAQPPGGGQIIAAEEKVPPLLHAAHNASIESVEWFLSSAPLRRYKQFAENNKDDKRIKGLEESGKGFEKTIEAWLNANSELMLHAAILHVSSSDDKDATKKQLELIKHILSLHPELLEHQSSEGFTPLHVAMHIQHQEILSYLISIGANQRHRDKLGRNLIHNMVVARSGGPSLDAKTLSHLISLFDKQNVKEMLLERCSVQPGSLTPLAYWMTKYTETTGHRIAGGVSGTEIIELLSGYSTGEDLGMINGEGDLPLHVVCIPPVSFIYKSCLSFCQLLSLQAVKNGQCTIAELLLTLNPSLLHRENTTGRTPLEMARDIYVSSSVEDPPAVFLSGYHHYQYNNNLYYHDDIVTRAPVTFLPKPELDVSKQRTYEICEDFRRRLAAETGAGADSNATVKTGSKRKLASLFEANEVAKRLSENKRVSRGGYRRYNYQAYQGNASGEQDLVSTWLQYYNQPGYARMNYPYLQTYFPY